MARVTIYQKQLLPLNTILILSNTSIPLLLPSQYFHFYFRINTKNSDPISNLNFKNVASLKQSPF